MIKLICIASLACLASPVLAQDMTAPATGADVDRDPAAISMPTKKRTYAGGGDEEDLRVLAALPEAAMKTDQRSLQKEVYKQLFNQDLKEESHDELEEQ
jgi:hypothetical protein